MEIKHVLMNIPRILIGGALTAALFLNTQTYLGANNPQLYAAQIPLVTSLEERIIKQVDLFGGKYFYVLQEEGSTRFRDPFGDHSNDLALTPDQIASAYDVLIYSKNLDGFAGQIKKAGFEGSVLQSMLLDSFEGLDGFISPEDQKRPCNDLERKAIFWQNNMMLDPGSFCKIQDSIVYHDSDKYRFDHDFNDSTPKIHATEEWFLHDLKGNRIANRLYGLYWFFPNPKNKEMQEFFIAMLLRNLGHPSYLTEDYEPVKNMDGVYLDNLPIGWGNILVHAKENNRFEPLPREYNKCYTEDLSGVEKTEDGNIRVTKDGITYLVPSDMVKRCENTAYNVNDFDEDSYVNDMRARVCEIYESLHSPDSGRLYPLFGNLIGGNDDLSEIDYYKDCIDGYLKENFMLGWGYYGDNIPTMVNQLNTARIWMNVVKKPYVAVAWGGCNKYCGGWCRCDPYRVSRLSDTERFNDHIRLNRFAFAALLLVSDPELKYPAFHYTTAFEGAGHYEYYFYFPEYYANLGKPTEAAPEIHIDQTEYSRNFEKGLVYINLRDLGSAILVYDENGNPKEVRGVNPLTGTDPN